MAGGLRCGGVPGWRRGGAQARRRSLAWDGGREPTASCIATFAYPGRYPSRYPSQYSQCTCGSLQLPALQRGATFAFRLHPSRYLSMRFPTESRVDIRFLHCSGRRWPRSSGRRRRRRRRRRWRGSGAVAGLVRSGAVPALQRPPLAVQRAWASAGVGAEGAAAWTRSCGGGNPSQYPSRIWVQAPPHAPQTPNEATPGGRRAAAGSPRLESSRSRQSLRRCRHRIPQGSAAALWWARARAAASAARQQAAFGQFGPGRGTYRERPAWILAAEGPGRRGAGAPRRPTPRITRMQGSDGSAGSWAVRACRRAGGLARKAASLQCSAVAWS